MFKLFGSALIIVCCMYMGITKQNRIKRRIHGLGEFRAMIEQLRVEIELKNNPLPRAIKQIGISFNNECFLKCSKKIQSLGGQAAFEKSLLESSEKYCFEENDISAINNLSSGLGKCDVVNQLRQLDYCVSRIDAAIDEANAEYAKKSTMYVSCSVLIGVFVVLILL